MADISASLPDADLLNSSTVTVDVGSAGATIVSVTVHGFQDDGDPAPPTPDLGFSFVPVALTAQGEGG